MNQMVLLLNAVILATTFIVSFSTTNTQLGILDTGAQAPALRAPRRQLSATPESAAVLRVVHSLGNFMDETAVQALQQRHFAALRSAVRSYFVAIDAGVAKANNRGELGRSLDSTYARIGADARQQAFVALRDVFKPDSLATRLTAEVMRHCR